MFSARRCGQAKQGRARPGPPGQAAAGGGRPGDSWPRGSSPGRRRGPRRRPRRSCAAPRRSERGRRPAIRPGCGPESERAPVRRGARPGRTWCRAATAARPPQQLGPAPLPWERGGATSRRRGPGLACVSPPAEPARLRLPALPAGSGGPAGLWGPPGCREPGAAARPRLQAPVLPLRCYIPAAAAMFYTLLHPTSNAISCPVIKRFLSDKSISPPLCSAGAGFFPLAGGLGERGWPICNC